MRLPPQTKVNPDKKTSDGSEQTPQRGCDYMPQFCIQALSQESQREVLGRVTQGLGLPLSNLLFLNANLRHTSVGGIYSVGLDLESEEKACSYFQ